MVPTREVYWNIDHASFLYFVMLPAIAVGLWRLWTFVAHWRTGKPANRFDRPAQRWQSLLIYGFGQKRVARHAYAGIFHGFLFAGLVILFIGTLVVWVHVDFGLRIMQGSFYLYFQSLTLDLFGLFAVIALLMILARRMFFKPARLANDVRDWIMPALLLAILVTGFMLEGLRLGATTDPWAVWSPVGLAFGRMFSAMMSVGVMRSLHAGTWWFHMALVASLFAIAPFSKLLHVVTAPANIYFRSLEPKGRVAREINLETAESFGTSRLEQLTWKDYLDLDACTECGRCQDACPAHATGKPLSPKALILDMRGVSHDLAARSLPGPLRKAGEVPLLTGGVIAEETLWSCTNCMACMEACPVFIEHVPKIIDMRRYLVMEEGRLPATMEGALRHMESRGHPFAGATASRTDWCKGLDVKIAAQAGPTEYLYWVGCAGAMNPRSQKVARAFAETLIEAGVDFSILGEEEQCTGDSARRMGNELLFETMAQRNIGLLAVRGVKKIITTCPHCFNTFKNEYPALGGTYEVFHHSEILDRLVAEGKWRPKAQWSETITFHDPCHLGRYNGIVDAPRNVISAAAGAPIEMARAKANSFCCGAGGGRMWADEPPQQRVSRERARQALATAADVVGVGCPFCMAMLDEAVSAEKGDRDVRVLDIAELLRGPEPVSDTTMT
jgi:Fe-S oxidoreductase/nitrate reductase gamma subunit